MRNHAVLNFVVTIYVVFIILWMTAKSLFFDQFWLIALPNTVAEYLFAPLPILLITSIWKRDWISLAKLSIPLTAFVVLFGHLFWPPPQNHVVDEEQVITVMSFNVLYSNKAYEAIVESIQSANPDVVGFQELRPASAKSIARQLETNYPYNTLQSLEAGQSAGILSKYPIERVEWFDLPPLDIALHTIVRVEGEEVHMIVVHLSPNSFFDNPATEFVTLVRERYGRREKETIRLKQMIQDLNEPVVLMCDCNMTDTSEAYARLDTVLDDSFSEVGWGIGHTFQPPQLSFPVQRIDYVWHSEEFKAIQAYVGQDGGSDHLPIVAKLWLIP